MTNRTSPQGRLAALGAHLSARRLEVELTDRGLRVQKPDATGCCPDATTVADVITCRPRPDDGGRAWFFTSWNEPIAEADHVTDATTFVLGYLTARREPEEPSR